MHMRSLSLVHRLCRHVFSTRVLVLYDALELCSYRNELRQSVEHNAERVLLRWDETSYQGGLDGLP